MRDGKLWIAEGPRAELLPLSESRFALRGLDGEAVFDRRPAGRTCACAAAVGAIRSSADDAILADARAARRRSRGAIGARSWRPSSTSRQRIAPLVLSERRPGSFVMRPVYTDAFRGGIGVTEVSRDASGRVTGFIVNAGRVRALRFDRIE